VPDNPTCDPDCAEREFTCINCGQVGDSIGECFGHPDAEPGWPVFHTPPCEYRVALDPESEIS